MSSLLVEVPKGGSEYEDTTNTTEDGDSILVDGQTEEERQLRPLPWRARQTMHSSRIEQMVFSFP